MKEGGEANRPYGLRAAASPGSDPALGVDGLWYQWSSASSKGVADGLGLYEEGDGKVGLTNLVERREWIMALEEGGGEWEERKYEEGSRTEKMR